MTVDLRDSRIAEVCRRYGVAELSVFGSAARGDDTDSSDVDLLYVLAPDSTLGFEIVDLRDELEKIVGRCVDLVPKSRLKWVIRDRRLGSSMRRDELYLVDMIEAAVAATAFVRDVDETAFLASDLIQSAVL
ncbi:MULTISPECIES: nucleotidyltransferase domain-containing protein [unclassified Frankia]